MDILSVLSQATGKVWTLLVQGGLVMIPLLLASIISGAVIIERWVFWRRFKTQESGPMILSLVAHGKHEQAVEIAQASQHPVARVLQAGIEHLHPAPTIAMESVAQAEVFRLKRYLPILDTIITLAPLLGLLGTITGMISAFGVVSDTGLGQPHAITGGIAEALIATATGLSVAIMTLVPYNYFQAKAEAMTALMEERATRLELLLQEGKD